MSTPKCEMCGRDIPNAKNRQKFCHDCSKKRQAEQSHKSYLKHREYYLERSLAQAERRKQEAIEAKRLEELLLAKRPEPKYSISQVVKKSQRARHQLWELLTPAAVGQNHDLRGGRCQLCEILTLRSSSTRMRSKSSTSVPIWKESENESLEERFLSLG